MRNSAYRGEAALSPVISLALPQALQSWDGFLDSAGEIPLPVDAP